MSRDFLFVAKNGFALLTLGGVANKHLSQGASRLSLSDVL